MNENKNRRNEEIDESKSGGRTGKGSKFKGRNTKRGNSMASNSSRGRSNCASTKDGKRNMKNDESWYLKNPELTQTATAFNLLYPTGVSFNLLDSHATVGSESIKMNPTNLAGVCAFRYIPSIGFAASATDPVNVATTKIYAYVRHMNSGHTNYESADLMLYLLQMRQCYSWYMWMTRLYGVLNSYSALNRNLPKALVAAMGVDYDDVIANMPNLLFHINTFVSKLNALSVPSEMKIYERAAWMNVGVYYDADITKAQLYMFQPYSYTIYNATEAATGGKLTQVKMPISGLTYSNIVQISNSIIDPVFNDEDMNIMSGDVLKAYGDKCLSATPVDTSYITYPTYVPEVIDQIHNIRILGVQPEGDELAKWDISQANGVIKCTPTIKGTSADDVHVLGAAIKNLMDFPDNNITEGRTLEASRFMYSGVITLDPTSKIPQVSLENFGTEVITAAQIFTMNNGVPQRSFNIYTTFNKGTDTVRDLRVFTGAPILFMASKVGDAFMISSVPEGELGNYLMVEPDVLYMLHQTALMSIFDL